jgi:hypothetical protein
MSVYMAEFVDDMKIMKLFYDWLKLVYPEVYLAEVEVYQTKK